MDHDADPGVNRGTVDLTKLTNEELIETVKELIEENIALKDKLRIVERTLALKNGAGQDAAAFHDNQDVTTTDFEVMTNRDGNGSDDSGEHEHEHEHDSGDKVHEKDEVEEVDSEAYFKKMTEIIRDMAKSPSVILNYHEVDNFMSSKKGHKEKADIKMWERDIIPFLKDKEHREKTKLKIKSVIYSFIPTKHRAKVWPMLIGNPLRIKREIYDHFCTLLETNPVDQRVSHIIREDLVRTYPNFKCFNRGEALNSELQCLLELFQFARPDIGYVQGMAYPATMLLLHMDRYHAFKCLMNMIVSNPFLKALFTFNLKESRRSFRAFDHYLKQKSPASYKHLMKMDVQSETFLIEWYYTLFCRSFAIQDAAKIWDVFLLEGEIVFLRVALRIFQAVEPQLLKKDYAQTLSFIRSCTATIDIDTIFKQMQNSKMTVDRLERFYEKDKKKVRMSEEKPQTN